jgi:hypothetical protein
MNPPTTSSELPSAPRRWQRVAGGVAVFLLCYFVVAQVIVPQGERGGATEFETTSTDSGSSATASVLQADLRALKSSRAQMDEVVAEIELLAGSAPWRASGFFDARQQDQIEGLLFRYLACRHVLWHLANYHKDNDTRYPDAESKAKSSAIALNAGFHLVLSDASLVSAFRGDTVAIDKLNEEFYRSRIPPRTYERLRLGVTNEEQIAALRDSFLLYTSELDDAESAVDNIVSQNSEYNDLVNETKSAAKNADEIVGALVDTQSPLLPNLENEIRHTRVAQLLRGSEAKAGNLLFAARAHLFKGVSRIKNPEAHLIKFSADQKQQVYGSLEPGDIILTFTAGYISDIFIPGAFKHAITFVGSPQNRQSAGLTADRIAWLPDAERDVLLKSVAGARLPSGQDADVIEAVGEGVIFNHLGHIMDTHINRLLVLRPKVSAGDRTHALVNVFLFLGDGYDFKFDFADASRQVCTEVVYRALDGKGPIRFSLIERAGHETLSADDIANNFLAAPGKTFDFVLFAEEASGSQQHHARILVGDAGTNRLKELMESKNE